MTFPDVNVLIYAHREDAPEHVRFAEWLRNFLNAPEPFGLSELVLSSFVRIVTNPKIFDPATPTETALQFCERLLDWPRSVLLVPTARHWEIFARLCRRAKIKGALVTDAYIAALAIEHGCELITTDSDFARSEDLRWRHPLAPN